MKADVPLLHLIILDQGCSHLTFHLLTNETNDNNYCYLLND